jgi:hypothetical protein
MSNPTPMEVELVTGIEEHLARARMFLAEAQQSKDSQVRHRKLIAAVYFCQAFQELMLETAYRGMTTVTRDVLQDRLLSILPHADLIYIVRIHDFHRMTIIPHEGYLMRGPAKLTTGNRPGDSVALTIVGGVPAVAAKRGNSVLKLDRPLVTLDGAIHDADSGQYLSLEVIITRFLERTQDALDFFLSVYQR